MTFPLKRKKTYGHTECIFIKHKWEELVSLTVFSIPHSIVPQLVLKWASWWVLCSVSFHEFSLLIFSEGCWRSVGETIPKSFDSQPPWPCLSFGFQSTVCKMERLYVAAAWLTVNKQRRYCGISVWIGSPRSQPENLIRALWHPPPPTRPFEHVSGVAVERAIGMFPCFWFLSKFMKVRQKFQNVNLEPV